MTMNSKPNNLTIVTPTIFCQNLSLHFVIFLRFTRYVNSYESKSSIALTQVVQLIIVTSRWAVVFLFLYLRKKLSTIGATFNIYRMSTNQEAVSLAHNMVASIVLPSSPFYWLVKVSLDITIFYVC